MGVEYFNADEMLEVHIPKPNAPTMQEESNSSAFEDKCKNMDKVQNGRLQNMYLKSVWLK